MIALDFTDLGLALGLMGMAIALSVWQKLGLERTLAIATIRTLVQLGVVGYVLAVVFDPEKQNPLVTLGVLLLLLTLISVVTRHRISRKIPALFPLVWISLFLSTGLTIGYSLLLLIQPQPWYEAQYLIPLGAIILGNGMNSATLAGERLVSLINRNPGEIETHLSLGATPALAMLQYRTEAIRAGLLPSLNAMMIVGIVTLPGILNGQLLAGIRDPLNAVSYQILILFVVVAANLITTLLLTQGICRQYFNAAAQLKNF